MYLYINVAGGGGVRQNQKEEGMSGVARQKIKREWAYQHCRGSDKRKDYRKNLKEWHICTVGGETKEREYNGKNQKEWTQRHCRGVRQKK